MALQLIELVYILLIILCHFAVPVRLSGSSLEQNNSHVFVVHSPNILETIHFFKLKLEQTGKSIKLK
jgi:hypothetical protein